MIIGICGFQSSGKDSIAKFLIEQYGFQKLSFAGALKDIVSIMFGWPRSKLEGLTPEDREWRDVVDPWWAETLEIPQLTPRYILQHFGTDLFRKHFHQDIWVKIVENKLKQLTNDGINVVITDCRFENEINLITKYGGKIVKVYRDLPQWFHKYQQGVNVEEAALLHASEVNWIRSHCDYELTNDGTLLDLYEKIKYIMKKTT
jgi:hypothetical protein